MTSKSTLDQRKNKRLVIENRSFLKEFTLANFQAFGQGIVVINLLLLKTDDFQELGLLSSDSWSTQEITVHQPLSYIPQDSFWFKMISLKIKKKYQINIQEDNSLANKFLIVFIKDASVEHFSIYSLKINIHQELAK